MAEATSASDSIVINAPSEIIWDVITDLEAYPDWAKNVKNVEVLEEDDEGWPLKAKFTVDAVFKKVDYTLEYEYTESEMIFTYVEGDLDDVKGKYVLDPIDEDSTDVFYEFALAVSFPIPGIKSMAQKRANKMIISSALKDLKKRSESLV